MGLTKIKLILKIKRPVFAWGGQTKNTLCFAQGSLAYLSRIHPDLTNPKDFSAFIQDAKYLLKKNPRIMAYDLHPEYSSTKFGELWAQSHKVIKSQVQHHHAHIAAAMAENGLKNQKVLGVAFDGTGLGPDGKLWGGEFLICDYKNFKRAAHLKEIPLLGGEQAIKEPWRIAAAWVYQAYQDKFLNLKISLVKNLPRKKWQVLKQMQEQGLNSPLASSLGRLFDAVASLVLKQSRANFEAELAIKLEKLASHYKLLSTCHPLHTTYYPFKVVRNTAGMLILDPLPMFRQIVADLAAKRSESEIAYRFHLTVAEMIKRSCCILRRKTRLNKVVLSGGVFQNKILLGLSSDLLSRAGFKVFKHKNLSSSDASLALGQAIIAATQHRNSFHSNRETVS